MVMSLYSLLITWVNDKGYTWNIMRMNSDNEVMSISIINSHKIVIIDVCDNKVNVWNSAIKHEINMFDPEFFNKIEAAMDYPRPVGWINSR